MLSSILKLLSAAGQNLYGEIRVGRRNVRDSKGGVVARSRADYHRGTLRLVMDYFTALNDHNNSSLQASAALEVMS
ncbi:MAG: hypothetical protein VX346_02140 [Planctomycetota bacterium]|nr:hypothetical protein [Planctomycetota bacterium]